VPVQDLLKLIFKEVQNDNGYHRRRKGGKKTQTTISGIHNAVALFKIDYDLCIHKSKGSVYSPKHVRLLKVH
jgi:hypothetical protein